MKFIHRSRGLAGNSKISINFAKLVAAVEPTRYSFGPLPVPGTIRMAKTAEQIEIQMIVELQNFTPAQIIQLIEKICEDDAARAQRLKITPEKLIKQKAKIEKSYADYIAKGANLYQLRANRIRSNKYMILPEAIEKLLLSKGVDLDTTLLKALADRIDQQATNDPGNKAKYFASLAEGLNPIIMSRMRKGDIEAAVGALITVSDLEVRHAALKMAIPNQGNASYQIAAMYLFLTLADLRENHPEIAQDQNFYSKVKDLIPNFTSINVNQLFQYITQMSVNAFQEKNYRTSYLMYELVSLGFPFADNGVPLAPEGLLDRYGKSLLRAKKYLESEKGKEDLSIFTGAIKEWVDSMQSIIDTEIQNRQANAAAIVPEVRVVEVQTKEMIKEPVEELATKVEVRLDEPEKKVASKVEVQLPKPVAHKVVTVEDVRPAVVKAELPIEKATTAASVVKPQLTKSASTSNTQFKKPEFKLLREQQVKDPSKTTVQKRQQHQQNFEPKAAPVAPLVKPASVINQPVKELPVVNKPMAVLKEKFEQKSKSATSMVVSNPMEPVLPAFKKKTTALDGPVAAARKKLEGKAADSKPKAETKADFDKKKDNSWIKKPT